MRGPEIGQTAPNFDLSSTEGVLLMLRDECVHTAIVLYVAPALSDRTRTDLQALESASEDLAKRRARPLAMFKAPMPELMTAQRELGLHFPLLTDDRAFLAAYGVESDAGEEPALYMIDRSQVIRWRANPAGSIASSVQEIRAALKAGAPGSGSYPRQVINRVVERWVGR